METSENAATAPSAGEAKFEDTDPQSAPKQEKQKQSFKCLVCQKSYSKKTSLFTHHKTHPEHCVHCGENRGAAVESIYEHNRKHINIRPFICKICGDSFLRNQQFVEHEKSHDKPPEEPVVKESKYKCKTCQSSYSNWKLFYKHQQESGHFNEKFLCEICGSDFHSNFLLAQHIRRLHKRTDETFACSSCSKIFATKLNLDSHFKKIHQTDNKNKFFCETCNNYFSSQPNLKQHIKTVHQSQEYECQTCKKPFKAKNRLTRHEKEVHNEGKNGSPEEIRMFNCDHCQKKYKRSWHQARHSQMKHENSNASTATTSSAGTPPTPEINGNVLSINNNLNYQHHLQQVPPLGPEISQQLLQNHQQNVPLVTNQWDTAQQPPPPPQDIFNASTNDMLNQNLQQSMPRQRSDEMNNGEYVNYVVNEQYSNKFEQVQAPHSVNSSIYDPWNPQQPSASFWEYNQPMYPDSMQRPMYSHHPQNEWYYDPNYHQQQHGLYNNTYNNYKTDYNCLNQLPAPIQNTNSDPGGEDVQRNYYFPPPQITPHPQDQHSSSYHESYHNSM